MKGFRIPQEYWLLIYGYFLQPKSRWVPIFSPLLGWNTHCRLHLCSYGYVVTRQNESGLWIRCKPLIFCHFIILVFGWYYNNLLYFASRVPSDYKKKFYAEIISLLIFFKWCLYVIMLKIMTGLFRFLFCVVFQYVQKFFFA